MRITFLIGNGFDLNAGLKTRFSDFFKVYCEETKNDTPAIKQFKEDISTNIELWSDFEKQMGEYTFKVAQDIFQEGELSIEEYYTCIDDFRNKFIIYLNEEIKHPTVLIMKDRIREKCQDMLINPFRYLRTGQRERLYNYIKNAQPRPLPVEYGFVVFNYTDMCEECMGILGSRTIRGYCDGPIEAVISADRFVYVHGRLGSEILLGVDNISQISNPFLRNDEEFLYSIVKPISNRELESGQDERAKELIEASNIIIIYGMSLGETDKSWWRVIADWLLEGKNSGERFLVVYSCDGTTNRNSTRNAVRNQKEVRRKFLEVYEYELEEKDKEYITDHIFCALNTDILKI